MLNADGVQICVKRNACLLPEDAAEISAGKIYLSGHAVQRQLFSIMGTDVLGGLMDNVGVLDIRKLKQIIHEAIHRLSQPAAQFVHAGNPRNNL